LRYNAQSDGIGESMATRKRNKPMPPAPASCVEKPWWKSTWLKVTAAIGALALLLTNVNSILSSSRMLPEEAKKTSDQFWNWYADYAAWKGYWTNFPEGFANMEEMNLSKEDFRLNISDTANGAISGTIETRRICDNVPYFERLLVDGTISSSGLAEISIFDFVGGFRRNFARLQLKRDDYMMSVIQLHDPVGLFAKETRIARAPLDLIGPDDLEALCGDKQIKFIQGALKKDRDGQSPGATTKLATPNR
jgi:hypothetical protein